MRFRGGHNVLIEGKPSGEVKELAVPDALYLPLFSRRFVFSEVRVADGDEVKQGQILATDPGNHSVPLLSPASGTVKLDLESRHVTLENVRRGPDEAVPVDGDLPDAAKSMGEPGKKRNALLRLGAWQFFSDVCVDRLPDPFGAPRALIVSTVRTEPFLPNTEALLRDRMSEFSQGLEQLHTLLENVPITLVIPEGETDLAGRLRDVANKCSWAQRVEIPPTYPFDNPKLIAQLAGLNVTSSKGGSIWNVGIAGVLAVDAALTSSKACVSRTISVGGPGSKDASHASLVPGYPMEAIMASYADASPVRVIDGGVLTGRSIDESQKGLDTECESLTLIAENTEREILAFAHMAFGKQSFTNAFASALRPRFREHFTTAIRGEPRPCLSCGTCESVCPAELMPHMIYRYIHKGRMEEGERFGLFLCVACGLCSFVCPSKIEHRQTFLEARETIRRKAQAEEERS